MPDMPSLAQLVTTYLARYPGQEFKPWQIAEGLSTDLDGRHVGAAAVTNTCLHEAAHGRLVRVGLSPMTFAHLARAKDDGQQ